jgi:broad specificity phosphatase PhoE
MHLYVIRHADPDYDHDTLTRQGLKEARALARRMASIGLTRLYASPVPRAVLTAQAIAKLSPLPIGQEDWLIEPSYLTVVQDGTTYKIWDLYGEVIRSGDAPPTQETWNRAPPFDSPEVGGMWRGFRRNADEFLARHGYVREGNRYRIEQGSRDRIALVGHNGTVLLLLAHLLELPLSLVWCGFFAWPSSVTVFFFEEHSRGWAVPRALTVADVSHLYAAKLGPQPRAFGNGLYTPFL